MKEINQAPDCRTSSAALLAHETGSSGGKPTPQRAAPYRSDRVLSGAEVCARAGISRDTLRRQVKAGKLRMLQLSARRVGFWESEYERWLASCVADDRAD